MNYAIRQYAFLAGYLSKEAGGAGKTIAKAIGSGAKTVAKGTGTAGAVGAGAYGLNKGISKGKSKINEVSENRADNMYPEKGKPISGTAGALNNLKALKTKKK
jgi:hypothetical protein